MHDSLNFSELKQLGFAENRDGTNDPRCVSFTKEIKGFKIHIDAWMQVTLHKKGWEGDPILLVCQDKIDLEHLIEFLNF